MERDQDSTEEAVASALVQGLRPEGLEKGDYSDLSKIYYLRYKKTLDRLAADKD